MNLRHLAFFAAASGAVAAVAACGGPATLNLSPAAATRPASTGPASPASMAAQAAARSRCDATAWVGAISPEGRPDGLDAGDAGAVYVWHDGDGWHIRATDQRPTDHHYTGAIRLSAGSFVDVRPVRDERDDHVSLSGQNVLLYDFHTFASIDGVDFHVTCPPERQRESEHQTLAFHTLLDGQPAPDRVRIGDSKQSPRSADFAFARGS